MLQWGYDDDGDVVIFVIAVSFTIYKTSVLWQWGNAINVKGTKTDYYNITEQFKE